MSELALPEPRPAPALAAGLVRRPLLTLFVLCLLAWLPGFFTLPTLDRDEARFAQASKQMVETGDLVDIRFGAEARNKKPAGIYWLQAASTRLLGTPPFDAIWTYRLPSLVGAVVAVFLAFWCLCALAPPATALIGAGLLALTLGLSAEAHIAKTDAVLLAAVLGAQGVLLRVYLAARDVARRRPGLGLVLAGWTAMAVGVLVKGPVIVAVLGLTALAISLWDRDWRWLAGTRPLPGLALLLVLVLPWFIAIGLATHGQFYAQSVGHDFAGKLVGGEEGHGAPPGYYVLLATVTLWPATLFALPGVAAAIADRRQPAMRFLLAWAGANWLMFALVPTKLPHYILPVYPVLAFVGALWLMRDGTADDAHGRRWLRCVAVGQFAIGTIALAAGVVAAPDIYGSGAPVWLIGLATLGGLVGLAAAGFIFVHRPMRALAAAVLSALILYPSLMWGTAPRLTRIWISPRLAALVAKDSRPGDPPVVTSGYDEPSLVFLLGTHTQIAPGARAAELSARQGGLALVDNRQRPAFTARLAQLGATAVAVDQLSGIDYSRGKPEHITIYRVNPVARPATPAE